MSYIEVFKVDKQRFRLAEGQRHIFGRLRQIFSIHLCTTHKHYVYKYDYMDKSKQQNHWKPSVQISLKNKKKFLADTCTYTVQKAKKCSKFPRYDTKCRGKRETTRNILHSISFSLLKFVLYLGKSRNFWDSVYPRPPEKPKTPSRTQGDNGSGGSEGQRGPRTI